MKKLLLAVLLAVCSNAQASPLLGWGQWRDYNIGIHTTTPMTLHVNNGRTYTIRNKGTTVATKEDITVYVFDNFTKRYYVSQIIVRPDINGVIFKGALGNMESFLLIPATGSGSSTSGVLMPLKMQ